MGYSLLPRHAHPQHLSFTAEGLPHALDIRWTSVEVTHSWKKPPVSALPIQSQPWTRELGRGHYQAVLADSQAQ